MKEQKPFAPPTEFHKVLPRTIFAEVQSDFSERHGATGFTGGTGYGMGNPLIQGFLGTHNIYRTPARRFYDPETTTSSIYLPRAFKQRNRWNRFFFDHDELVGAVLTLHAELPHSRAEFLYDDKMIAMHVEECVETIDLFSMLPLIDLEYLKIGEVVIHTPWDDTKGMWSHIIIQNPDYIELTFSPFAANEAVIELVPSDELKRIVYSNKPEDQQLKKMLPKEIVRRVLTGKNIILNNEEVTHIARRSNPYDERGTSIINRLHRLLMYEDKLREAQLTIADNFIYPLKLFKLGDPQKGWVPDDSHMRALAQVLLHANFDPNFALIYHYGLQVEYITVADRVMRLDKEWTEINERKMIGLGVSKQFVNAEVTYSSANVGLQIQLARYKAKRDVLEGWIRKLLRIMAKRNGWYRRDAREIVGQFRVSRKGPELEERLIMPEIVWHKKLMMRDDQNFLTFLNNVYAQGKGPISTITLLMAMGLDLSDELHKKHMQKKLEEQYGEYIHPMQTAAPPPPPLMARIRDSLFGREKKAKQEQEPVSENIFANTPDSNLLTGYKRDIQYKSVEAVYDADNKMVAEIARDAQYISDRVWENNLKSPHVSHEFNVLYSTLNTLVNAALVKYGDVQSSDLEFVEKLHDVYTKCYLQGKLESVIGLHRVPSLFTERYSIENIQNYSDLLLFEEMHDWLTKVLQFDTIDVNHKVSLLRHLLNTCYATGQIIGLQEHGIYNVRVANVEDKDGVRYVTDELLSKGMNLANVISPNGEILKFYPCIVGHGTTDHANSVSKNVSRTHSFGIGGINVVDCPIDYVDDLQRVLSKLHPILSRKYSRIVFVDDVTNIKEWENSQYDQLREKFSDMQKEEFNKISDTLLTTLKYQKAGFIPHFAVDKTLYMSEWIGNTDESLVKKFMQSLGMYNIDVSSLVDKRSVSKMFDLTPQDINEYQLMGYISKIYDNNSNVVGWAVIADNMTRLAHKIPMKLKYGYMWDESGKCVSLGKISIDDLVKHSLHYWVSYPHKLDDEIVKILNEMVS